MNRFDPEKGNASRKYTLEEIQRAIDGQEILEAPVIECNKKLTLTLNIGYNIKGKIHIDDLELNKSDNEQAAAISKVGKSIKFIPVDTSKYGDETIVQCSRKLAQQQCYDNYISGLKPGDIIKAKALKYETYGIFCDIGCGIVSLLPTGKIRIPYIVDPKKENKCIKDLYAIVNSIDDTGKIELTHKELLGTWREQVSKISKGDVRLGKIISIKEYGYFIMLSQNLYGLAEGRDAELSIGDTVSVKIIHIIESKRKIKLQIIDKVEEQPIFTQYEYVKTEGHINEWEYFEDGKHKKVFSS